MLSHEAGIRRERVDSLTTYYLLLTTKENTMESLILAQDER
jgi:hypothetical protein